MSVATIINCIYCKQKKTSSKEHAVQKCLGGNLTIPLVCADCNGDFSSIDQALAENSLIALQRIISQEQKSSASTIRLGGSHYWIQDDGDVLEIEILARLRPKLKPQLLIDLRDDQIHFQLVGDNVKSTETLVNVFRKHIESRALPNIPILDPPKEASYKLPRIVLHRDKELYFRSSACTCDPRQFLLDLQNKLSKKIDSLVSTLASTAKNVHSSTVQKPHVRVQLSTSFNDCYRAVQRWPQQFGQWDK